MTKSMIENDDNTYSVKQLPEFDLLVTFNDYIIKSKNDRTTEVGAVDGSQRPSGEGVGGDGTLRGSSR